MIVFKEHNNLAIKVLGILIICLGFNTSYSQDTIYRFDINEFAIAVKENNLELKIAKKDKEFDHLSIKEASAAFLPQINVQGAYQRNFNKQKLYMEFPDFANIDPETGDIPVRLQEFKVGFKNDYQANFLLQQTIISLESIYDLKAAQSQSKIGDLKYADRNNEIVSEAKKVFMQAVLLNYVYRLEQLAEENAYENYLSAQNKLDNKLISEIDLLQAKIRWENEIPKTKKSRRNLLILLGNLKVIAGIKATDSLVVDYNFSLEKALPEIESMQNVFNKRNDYQMLVENIDLQKALLNKGKASYIPTLTGQLGYSYISNSDELKVDEYENKPFYAGLTLTIPIFSGRYRQAQVQKSKIQFSSSNLQRLDAEQKIVIEINNLQMKLHEEFEIIKSAETTLKTANKAYDLAMKNLDTGLISQLDLRRYSEDSKRAQLNLYYAVFNYECSQIDYNKAIGNNE